MLLKQFFMIIHATILFQMLPARSITYAKYHLVYYLWNEIKAL